MHREGPIDIHRNDAFQDLVKPGLAVRFRADDGWKLAIDPRHPARDALRELLAEMSHAPAVRVGLPRELSPIMLDPEHALGHRGKGAFRVLAAVAADGPLDIERLRRRIPDLWPNTVARAVEIFVRDRLLVLDAEGRAALSPRAPATLRPFVLALVAALTPHDPRLADRPADTGPRVAAFNRAADGAPRLFGTDVRLRNLMALAVHGPLLHSELRRAVGFGHMHEESREEAPFGRGGLVRDWDAEHGTALMLDPDHPVAEPMRRLLVAMERAYPLPAFVPTMPPPEPPQRRVWSGDRHAIFGGPIPTGILVTIGVLGWTFEALCVAASAGYHRENVKKAMKRMEHDGILGADRARGPGFNVRVVTISDRFPAKAELEATLRACAVAWPVIGDNVRSAMDGFTPKTKAHLKRRRLWP